MNGWRCGRESGLEIEETALRTRRCSHTKIKARGHKYGNTYKYQCMWAQTLGLICAEVCVPEGQVGHLECLRGQVGCQGCRIRDVGMLRASQGAMGLVLWVF